MTLERLAELIELRFQQQEAMFDAKLVDLEARLEARLEAKLDAKLEALEARLEAKLDAKLDAKIGSLRAEMLERFQARYRGKRYSFGYPACPDLEEQAGIFRLLHPEEIGVHLTDGAMMDPEASVSAIVLHHPSAVYFAV